MLIMLAKKIQVAYPVLLVLAGLVISFIPGVPQKDRTRIDIHYFFTATPL
jgi:hypothetical protein